MHGQLVLNAIMNTKGVCVMASKWDVRKASVKELHEQGLTIRESALKLGIPHQRVQDLKTKMGLGAKQIPPFEPTAVQEQYILGGMLGDFYLYRQVKDGDARAHLAHGEAQAVYMWHKYEVLKNMLNEPKERSWVDSRNGRTYREVRAYSAHNPYYTELYKRWYADGSKQVPVADLAKLNAQGVAVWFMDDGYKDRKGGYVFATNNFSVLSVHTLMGFLAGRFTVRSTFQPNRNLLYVLKEDAQTLVNAMNPFLIPEMRYKLHDVLGKPREFRENL